MQITTRKAFLESAKFYRNNWQDVLLLAAKTFFLMLIAEFFIAFLITALFGTNIISVIKWHWFEENKHWFNSTFFNSVSHLSADFHVLFIGHIIHILTYAWFIPPLIVSISRSIISGERFDRTLFRRLTQTRCLRLAVLLLIMGVLVSPGLVFVTVIPPIKWVTPTVVFVVLCWLILALYITFRLFYLEPTLAVDRQFSTIAQTWQSTRGKGWAMFKILISVIIFDSLLMLMLAVLIYFLFSSVWHNTRIVTFALLSAPLFTLIFDPLCIGAIAYVYKTEEKVEK